MKSTLKNEQWLKTLKNHIYERHATILRLIKHCIILFKVYIPVINKMWLIVYYYLAWQWHITRRLVSVHKDQFLMLIPWTWVKEPSVLNTMIELHFCLSDQWMALRYDIQTKTLCSESTTLQLINMSCGVIGIYR